MGRRRARPLLVWPRICPLTTCGPLGARLHYTNDVCDIKSWVARRFRLPTFRPGAAISPMSSRATMSARRLLSTSRVWFACISLVKIYHHDFVESQELASQLHHQLLIIAEKTQHARGLTILYPWLRADTHHGDFADGLCHCPSKMRAATLYLKRPTPLNRTYHHHGDFAENKCR